MPQCPKLFGIFTLAVVVVSSSTAALSQKPLDLSAADRPVLQKQSGPVTTPAIRDSVKNGAIIGAAVLSVWCAVICGQGLESTSQLPLAVAVNAGFGALIGAGIDALFTRSTTPGTQNLHPERAPRTQNPAR